MSVSSLGRKINDFAIAEPVEVLSTFFEKIVPTGTQFDAFILVALHDQKKHPLTLTDRIF